MEEVALVRRFLKTHRLAVQASNGESGIPQSAVVGVAPGPGFEFYFDTLDSTRKCGNLRRDPRVSLVLGWDLDEGITLQVEGVADEPQGDELTELKQAYFAVFADGRERQGWRGITYFRIRPTWLRYSDYSCDPPRIFELDPKAVPMTRIG